MAANEWLNDLLPRYRMVDTNTSIFRGWYLKLESAEKSREQLWQTTEDIASEIWRQVYYMYSKWKISGSGHYFISQMTQTLCSEESHGTIVHA